jgi:hypothetical protein
VLFELETSGFPPRDTMQGLILATDAGRTDQSVLIADWFTLVDRAHMPGFSSALELIGRSEAALKLVAEHAPKSFVALVLAAWLDVPDREPLARVAAAVISRQIAGELGPDEHLRANDRGRIARWASPAHQAQVARGLVDTLACTADHGAHRFEAGEGLVALAERLKPATASTTLDRLLERQQDIATPSTERGGQSHANVHFARVIMHAPPATDHVRAIALRAACLLGSRCGRSAELQETVAKALGDDSAELRETAMRASLESEPLPDPDLHALLSDPDLGVRALALSALADRGELGSDDERLVSASEPSQPFPLRCAVLNIVREAPGDDPCVVERLMSDPHVYVRAAARSARESTQTDAPERP